MERTRHDRGRILGTAGGGLVDAPWAANAQVARIGRSGEIRTGTVLGELAAATGVTVLHDLRLPTPGVTANIDHAVIGGNVVLLIDTKVWKPGWYWSVRGVARRGWTRFQHAQTRTPEMARDSIERFLDRRGVTATVPEPVVAVWSSRRSGRVSIRFLQMTGCRPVRAETLRRQVRRIVPARPADHCLVQALAELVNGPGEPITGRMSGRDGSVNPFRSGPPVAGAAFAAVEFHGRPLPQWPHRRFALDDGR